jgi:hypothetical protein
VLKRIRPQENVGRKRLSGEASGRRRMEGKVSINQKDSCFIYIKAAIKVIDIACDSSRFLLSDFMFFTALPLYLGKSRLSKLPQFAGNYFL